MPMGPGKYDDICTTARELAVADGALLIVIRGRDGSGFSCQCDADTLAKLPEMLDQVSAEIRRSREHLLHERN